ncbi:rhamnulose-1-phosphate aldolase [Clostridia bacterium]|nr:rhamnulose-1-phosphate aldolase [Clostridia bacterium]
MNILETPAIKGFVRLCSDAYALGWHERNGGNLTYRMSESEVWACEDGFFPREWENIGVVADNLVGEYFIVTGTGKYFRNVQLDPAANIGIVEISENGGKYRIVWGLEPDAKPTSELPSHLLNHSVKKAATNGAHRVIYHAHTPNIIALTNVLPLNARDFSRVLWRSMPECPIVFPAGVGVVPWMMPGGTEVAKASAELMKTYDAIVWAHHGLFASGRDFDETFGLMHTVEKSAELHIKALSCGQGIKQSMSDEQIREIAKAYNLNLNAGFLV